MNKLNSLLQFFLITQADANTDMEFLYQSFVDLSDFIRTDYSNLGTFILKMDFFLTKFARYNTLSEIQKHAEKLFYYSHMFIEL